MTPVEVVETALKINLGSIPLSLAAVYAILGDKFIRPAVDRSDTVTSRLRGQVSALMAERIRPFTALESSTVARVTFLGQDGEPLDQASISTAGSVDSESFREAVRACLDERTVVFDSYWYSTTLSRRMRFTFRAIRLLLCVWPIFAVVGALYFGMLQHKVLGYPDEPWLWLAAVVASLPLLLFIGAMPIMSHYASCIDRLEH